MALSSSVSLAIAELAIYLLLAPLVVFILLKHWLAGLLGWFYLSAFIAVRIVGDCITISDRNNKTQSSTSAAILNSIGLSPLILSTAGVLHEATHYATSNRRIKFFNLVIQVPIHFAAMAGIALAVVAGVKLSDRETRSNQYSHDHDLQEAGSILIMLVWLTNVSYAIWLTVFMSKSRVRNEISDLKDSRILLMVTIVALPFVGVRTFYTVIYAFDHSPSVTPRTAKFAIKFVLVFLVQLVAAISLTVGGFLTRKIVKSAGSREIESHQNDEYDGNRLETLRK